MPAALPNSYTTVSLCVLTFPPINSVTTLQSAGISHYIGMVEADINSKIGGRYKLPLTVDCPILTSIATREAVYRIAVERGLVQFPPAQQGRAPMQTAHMDDMKMLDALAAGEAQLVDSSGAILSADTTDLLIYSTTDGYKPTMHEGPWTESVQDPDKIDTILSDRNL